MDPSGGREEWTLKLMSTKLRTQKREYCFTQRVINTWNSLLEEMVTATGTDVSKRGLEKDMEQRSINGYYSQV